MKWPLWKRLLERNIEIITMGYGKTELSRRVRFILQEVNQVLQARRSKIARNTHLIGKTSVKIRMEDWIKENTWNHQRILNR